MIKKLVYIVLLCWAVLPLSAQVIYECDFEDAAERSQWVLNPTANDQQKKNLTNFWNLGAPGHFAPQGEWGLFIGTSENATESGYSASKTIENVAYRELPTLAEGNYTLTFNWLANCKYGQEGLYACLVPVETKTLSGATALTMAWFKPSVLPLSVDTVMHGTSTWAVATCNFKLNVAGQYKLVFMFFSVKGAVVEPAPCVDNICLFMAGQCAAPTNVTHTIVDANVKLSWKGNADSYDIRTYSYETGKWQEINTTQTTYEVPNVDEGIGIFFLRSNCGDSHSEWVKYEKFIFHKGVRCIDYMDLNSKNCAYGSFSNPAASKGVVDFGYAEKESRHTLHYVINEVDPRTIDGSIGLKTKPDDALASVRLGNWEIGAQAEQITYNYKVAEDGNAILKLRYAVVMEDPAHDASAQPKFTLSIMHNNRKLDGNCGEANFVAGGDLKPEDGWHISNAASTPVYWKEWTTVSVNLRDYIGETITIKLTTYDCSQSGHYGYAYFVLDCENGEMSDLNCGEDNPTTEFHAPDGFNYRWYKADEPSKTLSEEQNFTIQPLDTNLYEVDVISKTNGQCYYTLKACGKPRIPTPRVTYETASTACSNKATFFNSSCVYVQNMVTGVIGPSEEKVTSLLWDFGDGTKVINNLSDKVNHEYPANGGEYIVKVTAGISHDACQITKEIKLTFPDISNDTTQIIENLCRKDYPYGYSFNGKTYYNDVDSLFTLTSLVTGCDSMVYLNLTWHESGPFLVKDTICEGNAYDLFGKQITEEGVYEGSGKGVFGCDSLVELHLHVVPRLTVTYPTQVPVCSDYRTVTIPYEVQKGFLSYIELRFQDAMQLGLDSVYVFSNGDPIEVVLPDSLEPAIMPATITFSTPSCPIPDAPIIIELRYSASVFTQKPGFIALMNEQYADYKFVEYQWYRDGEKIEGATYSFVSTTDDDIDHVYRVEVKIEGKDELVSTCNITYTGTTALQRITIGKGPYTIYSATGHYMKTLDNLNEIKNLAQGMYIIKNEINAIKIVR